MLKLSNYIAYLYDFKNAFLFFYLVILKCFANAIILQ